MLLEINAFIYISTLLIYYVRNPRIGIGLILLTFYAVSSVFAILFYNHPYFSSTIHNTTVSTFPFVYLYIVLSLFWSPILRFDIQKNIRFSRPKQYKLELLVCIILISSLLRIVFTFPHSLSMLTDGANLAANKGLVMAGENPVKVPFPLNIIFVISLLVSKLSVVLYFYLSAERIFSSVFRTIYGFFAFAPDILSGIADSSRASLFGFVINTVFAFLLFKNQLSSRFKRIFALAFFGILLLVVSYVVSVTLMRFGSEARVGMEFWQYKYFGESFVNFNGILFGNLDGYTLGDRNFSFFRRLLGLSDFHELIDIREHSTSVTGIPNYIFYMFVGHLIVDFGEISVLFLALGTFLFFSRFFVAANGIVSFSKLFLLQFYFRLCLEGLFYFPYGMHIGNLQIVLYLILYLYFRYNFVFKHRHNVEHNR